MALLLNNSTGRAGSGNVQTVTIVAVVGQSVTLTLRVDGPDAVDGADFHVRPANGAPIAFDRGGTATVRGTAPQTLTFHSPAGFTREGTHAVSLTDATDTEQIRIEARVIADPSVPIAPPVPPSRLPREILRFAGAGLIAIIAFAAAVEVPLWAYWALKEKYCHSCEVTPAADAAKAPAKPTNPCCVAK